LPFLFFFDLSFFLSAIENSPVLVRRRVARPYPGFAMPGSLLSMGRDKGIRSHPEPFFHV